MLNRFAALIIAALVFGALYTQAQDSSDAIKIDTRLVSVPVIVSDRNGRYVPNLTAANFTVMQDGTPQNIEFFAATEEPLTIALLIDTSHSTQPVLNDIKDSAKAFVRLLGPQDRAMIVCFDYDTHILSGLTSDHEQLYRAIKSAEIPDDFGTTLRDAAYQTVNRSFAGIKGRKAIIILTDGKDVGSGITTPDLLYALQETDTLIYTIMFKTGDRQAAQPRDRFPGGYRRSGGVFGGGRNGGRFPGGGFPPIQNKRQNPERRERVERVNEAAQEFLQKLADTTAGRFYSSKDGKLEKLFVSIVEELRFQYRLGFYPPEETMGQPLHELKVKVDRSETVVRSRGSYRTQNKTN
ncbi:MAG: VWA domain-containing protein [Acidobacteriota bacterium]